MAGPCPIASDEEMVGAALAKGAQASPQIKDFVNEGNMVQRLFGLRRSLDVLKGHSPELHSKVWEGISKETILARGIKFEPDQAALVESTLKMKPSEIADVEGFSDAQFEFLVNRRQWRKEAAAEIKAEIEATKEYYGDHAMPNKVDHNLKIMGELADSLSGRTRSTGTGDLAAVGHLAGAMNDFVFKWNTAYHAVNLLDPLIIGSSRVGMQRIMAAKAMIQTDGNVRDFLNSHDIKGPIAELRKEAAMERQNLENNPHIKQTLFGKATNKIVALQNKLPDLPSERWNTNDAMGASFINYGDRIGYPGGGTTFLKHLAEGKIDMDMQVEAYTDALQATQDITGSGALGLDKDMVQRNPVAKYMTQFTSQPMRVARLMEKWTKEKNVGAIGTFIAMSAFTGGRAVIPIETEFIMERGTPEMKAFLFAAQDMLDSVNLTNKVFGRDLTDKLRWSMIPFIGGLSSNLAVDQMVGQLRDLEGKKIDKATGATVLLTLSRVLGGGGGQIGKVQRGMADAEKGEKKVSVYTKFGDRPIGSETVKGWTMGDAMGEAFLPGSSTKIGAIKKGIVRKAASK